MTCGGEDVAGFDDGGGGGDVGGAGHEVEDLAFLGLGGVADFELQHEAVHLGFGERIGAFLFDGVLRGEDEEGFFEFEGVVADGDLFFLHGLEEGALDFGGGAVDFVGEDEVGEDGAFAGGEAAGLRIVNLGADDVGGEHVGGELEAGEFDAQGGGEGFDGEGFGEAGDAFEEDVAVGQEADDEALDEVGLADDDLADFVEEGTDEGGGALDFVVDCFDAGAHVVWIVTEGETTRLANAFRKSRGGGRKLKE